MNSLLSELKRRNVIRMAGLYLVGAWLVVQVVSTVLPAFELPAWVLRGVILLLAVGFVPALMFAWVFEWTPDGLKRDAEVPLSASIAPRTARRMDRLLLVVAAFAIGYFAVDKFLLAPRREAAPATPASTAAAATTAVPQAAPALDPRSIAVLPFASLSSEAENGFFADGLSEEILNSLARIDGMQVVGRTSSFQFKGKDEDLREIGRKLAVANVLEGSVRREGGRARITAQLIRASDGIHLWSNTYDRALDDTLAVQLDIAEQVAAVLDVLLDDRQRARMSEDGVRNVDAFIAYQKGVKLYDDAHDPERSSNSIDDLRLANIEFDRAASLQPGYAQAFFMAADRFNHILLADDRTDAERQDAQRQAMRYYGLVAEHSNDAQQRQLALVERQMVSDDWRGLADRIEAALRQPGCRNPDWLPVFASAFGYTALIEDLGRRTSACDPLNRINFNSRIRAALAGGQGQQALDILAAFEQSRGGVPMQNMVRVQALLVMGRLDDARATLAAMTAVDETRFKAEAFVAAAAGEIDASLRARLAAFDRSHSIYQFWDSADAIAAALSGDRVEANRRAAAFDARPAGPFLLAVLTADCTCGAPFDLEATPNFKARLEESGLQWPPPAAIKAGSRTTVGDR